MDQVPRRNHDGGKESNKTTDKSDTSAQAEEKAKKPRLCKTCPESLKKINDLEAENAQLKSELQTFKEHEAVKQERIDTHRK